ncbi:hypothetical protein [Pedobacter sp. NJ-S-72]
MSLVTDEELCSLSFKLYDHVSFYRLNIRLKEMMGLVQTHQAVLFISDQGGVKPVYIGQLSALLVSCIDRQVVAGKELVSLILDSFSGNEQLILETTVLRERIILQLRSLIISGMIGVEEEGK